MELVKFDFYKNWIKAIKDELDETKPFYNKFSPRLITLKTMKLDIEQHHSKGQVHGYYN